MNFGAVPIEDISVGMQVSYSQTITDADIKAYAGLSGDHNPVHVDEEYAENSRFKRRIAHGLFSSLFSPLYLALSFRDLAVCMFRKPWSLSAPSILMIPSSLLWKCWKSILMRVRQLSLHHAV